MLPAYLLLCLGLASVTAHTNSTVSITEFVVPKSVKVGDDVELKCKYKLENPDENLFYVKWWWTPLGALDDEVETIYQRLARQDPQSMHEGVNIKDNDTIELENVDAMNSGTYACSVSNDQEDKEMEELVVYTSGTGPLLNASTVEDGPDDTDIVVTCEAYDVAPEPEFRITVGSQIVPLDTVNISDPIEGLYNISVNATLEEVIDEGSTIACELLFKNTNVTHEPYIATISFEGSGADLTTTDYPEDTTQWETTTQAIDGSSTTLSNGLLLLGTAMIAQLLAIH